MTELPPGYSLRPASRDDLDAVVSVEEAYDRADFGHPYGDRLWMEEEWSKGRFDPSCDAWVVVGPTGDVVAFGQTYEEDPQSLVESSARVHPHHQGLGLGTLLVRRMEERAREHLGTETGASLRLLNDVTATDESAHRLLEAEGYALDRIFWHMWIDLEDGIPPVPKPDGPVVRLFDPETDVDGTYEVLRRAFAGHYGYAATPFTEWKELLRTPAYVPGLWLVAVSGNEVVGALTGRELMGEGWVQEVGVLAEWRGRGLAAALLTSAFGAFKARGLATAALNVDSQNETGATRLYERVGMRVRRRYDLFLKVLERA